MKFKALGFAFLLAASTAFAAPRSIASESGVPRVGDFGLGLELGTVTAATGKYWLSDRGALDFGIGFSSRATTTIYADYLWHIPGIFGHGTRFGRETSGYFGGGAGVGFWNHDYECGRWGCDSDVSSGVFVRGLVGFEWYPAPTRFGVFAELGPSILIAPHVDGVLDVDIGGRYYF